MKANASFIRIILLITVVLLAFSCDDTGDQRKQTRDALGEPDEIIKNDYASFKSELWVYARSDINRVYEYRKSAAGCGGSGEWYLYRRFYADYHFQYTLYDPPPVITHTPIESTVPGEALIIDAQVILNKKAEVDTDVKRVNIHYRAAGDSLTSFIVMSIKDEKENIYTGEIPGDEVTVEGLEYFIEATSDGQHWSRLPEDDFYPVVVSADSTGQVEKAGREDTTMKDSDYFTLPEPGASPGRTSPISP